jgi:two-component system phosphate regulon sensor histidine kinase PhoR
MLSVRQSTLRDWGLFVVVALLPAVAIGLLGLRALYNEEAAIRREMRLVLEQSAAEAKRAYDADLARLEEGGAAPFAESLTLSVPPAEASPSPSPPESPPECDELVDALRRGKDRDEARRKILADCEEARTDTGRWLWLVFALSKEAGVARQRLETWLSAHGPELSAAERTAARREISAASWLAEADKVALGKLLDGDGEGEASAPLRSEQRHAMRLGKPRITWNHERGRGQLVRGEDGTYRGWVVRPATLVRALRGGWPEVPAGVDARLVVGAKPPPGPTHFEVLEGGAWVELAYADPGAVEARTQRSKRILLAVAVIAVLVAMALAALLFARMRRERRVSALRTDFVAAVSHELRTPIASIRMLSELLADGSVDDEEEQSEMHAALAKEAERLGETVNRLLGFSRMEAGKQTSKRAMMPVAPPVEEAVSTARERHPDVDIESDIDEEAAAPIDAEAVKMAVTNLLTNAIKYAEPPFVVRLCQRDGGVRIEVSDTGPGLSKRDQKRIFRPFERADDRLSEATEGSGIGLSLVSHVARSHRGRAGVDSELGRGSTFYLWLPGSEEEET